MLATNLPLIERTRLLKFVFNVITAMQALMSISCIIQAHMNKYSFHCLSVLDENGGVYYTNKFKLLNSV